MNHILTVAKRELSAYFTSPIGYIFMMVFVGISVSLYTSTFFIEPFADVRPYFDSIPIMICIFIPAVTMRIWAQERSENTWEMLLTFPMKARELVLGKFLASFIFFIMTLSSTVTIPVMLINLGNPDGGTVISSYLGAILLGAYFLALGIFISGFFKDQILSFIMTLLACFIIFMLGNGLIAAKIDDFAPGIGTLLNDVVGFSSHYNAFIRGVIEVADITYFFAWTAILLFLNILYIDGRSRAGAKLVFTATAIVTIAIGLMANWLIGDTSLGRFDVTEDKIFTISDASKNILSNIDTPVQVKLYISPEQDMPTGMTTLQQDISDKMQELSVASNGNIEFSVINLIASEALTQIADPNADEDEEETTEEEVLEKRMLDKGVEPFAVQAMSQDQVMNQLVYSSIGVAYKNNKEEILSRILPQNIEQLEYKLISTVYKLTREKSPIVALVAPKEAINIPLDLQRMYEQMGQPIPESEDPYDILQKILEYEKYEIVRVELTQDSPLPDEYDTLVIVNPRNFNDRQRWEINRAIHSGKSVVMAVQNYEWNITPGRRNLQMSLREENPDVNSLLEMYGLGVHSDILMDSNNVPLNVQIGGGFRAVSQPVNSPMHMLISNHTMDVETSITSRLSAIFYLWGTALDINDTKLGELGLEVKTLITTSEKSWTQEKSMIMEGTFSLEEPETYDGPYPLMALVQGQFPDAFAEQERPVWPVPESEPGQPPAEPTPETKEAVPVVAAPGKLILLGSSQMFRKNFLQAGNLDLFLNSVDAVTLGEDLVNVRGRKPIDRLIQMPDVKTRNFWKTVNYGLASSIIALIGIVSTILRRRSRNAYTLSYMNETNN